jgi:hypothetical protein
MGYGISLPLRDTGGGQIVIEIYPNEIIGRWKTISRIKVPRKDKRGFRWGWNCVCSCGTHRVVLEQSLCIVKSGKNGGSRSCGCFHFESVFKHGESEGGGDETPEYRAWISAKKRCLKLSDPNYGGRGIKMCKEWEDSYLAFLRDVGRRPTEYHSLDRIDNDKGYEPGNCQWATAKKQAQNRRTTNKYKYNGAILTLREIAEHLEIPYHQAAYMERLGTLPAKRLKMIVSWVEE